MIDPFIFIIVVLIIHYILDDIIGQFMLSFALYGVFTHLSSFIILDANLTPYYELIVGVMILACAGKFFRLIQKLRSKKNVK